jgi:quinoprotein glucose dehydrogenase
MMITPMTSQGKVVYGAVAAALAMAVVGCAPDAAPPAGNETTAAWTAYGADAGGSRYSSLAQIDRSNVATLIEVWSVRTGDASHDDGSEGPSEGCGRCHKGDAKFEATPILAGGLLHIGTPLNRAVALDPATGREVWRFDPKLETNIERNEGFVSRGVSYWQDAAGGTAGCSRRIFLPTVDARLFALDAASGRLCPDFGEGGVVRLDQNVGNVQKGQYGVTSPPAIVGDVVIVGSSMGDNRRVDMERGTVRGYDARNGSLRWAWDPIPRDSADPAWAGWSPAAATRTGAANAWAPISADIERDMVFVPTGSAAPDFYGGERPGRNDYANSVVALRASTGKLLWHFQVVHHDLWDYDVAAQPTLITVPRAGRPIDAVLVATKMGHLFVLDRETGAPLFPVEERPVPPSDVPGEQAWPTQPFPTGLPPLHPTQRITVDDAFGVTPEEHAACRTLIASLRSEGVFTPPSLRGTLEYPGFGGGINWGGVAWDRGRHLVVANVLRLPMWVRLAPRTDPESGNQRGTPYTMTRAPLLSAKGIPCSKPPWGTIAAVDLTTGMLRWERPLGTVPALAGVPGSEQFGSANFGGPMVTAGGLVFIAATMDEHLRAFDVETGTELWKAKLPAGGQATPMTYSLGGRQYVVIAAGGHTSLGTRFGDFIVAFALPQ